MPALDTSQEAILFVVFYLWKVRGPCHKERVTMPLSLSAQPRDLKPFGLEHLRIVFSMTRLLESWCPIYPHADLL
jgi:hypothetical protein